MSSISAIGAFSAPPAAQAVPKVSDPDHDGDNHAKETAGAEAGESSRGPATRVTLSAAALASMAK